MSFKAQGIKVFLGILASSISVTAMANSYTLCSRENLNRNLLVEAGFFISRNEIDILKSPRPLDRNKNVSQEKIKERFASNIESVWKSVRKRPKDIDAVTLAGHLAKASSTVGVDFQILGSIATKESWYCADRYNESGGDSGCMQFTSAALNELKHQFGLAGSKNHSPGVPQVLKNYVSEYFKDNSPREKEFYRWMNLSTSDMRYNLRNKNYYDIDVFAGALLLKFYLAAKNGNYYKALVQYNGSKRKLAYATDVQNKATRISIDDTLECQIATEFATDVIETSYDQFGEDFFKVEETLVPPLPATQFI